MKKLKLNKGQSILGYLILFMLVAAALFTMGYYIRNAMSGRIRQAGDSIGGGAQYDPGPGSGHFGSDTATTVKYK